MDSGLYSERLRDFNAKLILVDLLNNNIIKIVAPPLQRQAVHKCERN